MNIKNIHQKRASYDEYKNYDYHTSFYIPAIRKLAFHLPHVHITVAKCDAQPLSDVNYFKMYYFVVIMLRG